MNIYKNVTVIFVLFFSSFIFSQSAVYEDLVVTATKKETSLMDTSAAIAAISGDDLNTRGITDISGLNQLSPDLVIAGEGHSRTNVRVRGVGTYGFTSSADPSTVLVIDGIAQPRISGAKHAFRDLERVEILKGPQGALYGTNALGGIVNIVTRKPSGGESGSFIISAGDNEDAELALNIETDINSSTSARISLARAYDAGTAFDETTGKDDGVESSFGRLALYGTYNNGVEWTSALSHSKDNQDAVVSEQDFLCNSTNPASHLLIIFATDLANSKFCSGTMGGNTGLNLSTASADIIKRGQVDLTNPIVIASLASKNSQPLNIPGYNFSEVMNFSYSAKMDWQDKTITALIGHNKVNSGEMRDFDATTIEALNQGHSAKSDTTSIELRLDSDPNIETPWSIGLYGMRDHGYRNDSFNSYTFGIPTFIVAGANIAAYNAANSSSPVTLAASSIPTVATWLAGCVVSQDCQAYATPEAPRPAISGRQYIDAQDLYNFSTVIGPNAVPSINNVRVGLKTYASAINGNITFPISDNMNLLLAGRYSVHDKPYTYSGKTNKPGQPLFVIADFEVSHGTTEKEFDPKVTLEMTDENSLSWITYATGYKSGGIGFGVFSAGDALKPYAAEKLEMIELGYKATLNQGSSQIELIFYNYDYKDHQQLLVCSTAQGPAGCVVNGDATLQGLDFSYRTFLSDNTSLGFSYGYADANWDKFIDTACCGVGSDYDRSGQQMPFVAENNLLLNLEHIQNSSIGEISYNLNVSYKDEYSVQLDRWEGVTLVEDLAIVNANVSLLTQNGIEISTFCTNCSDEEYLAVSLMGVRAQGGGARTAYAEGRRIGIQLSSDF